MRRLAFSAIALTLSATVTYFTAGNGSGLFAVLLPTSASAQSSACAFPTAAAATPEETAWRLFVAANCPGSGTKVIWENWIEQSQLYPASGTGAAVAAAAQPAKRLHGSPLAEALAARSRGLRALLKPATDCGPMHGPPSNVIKGAQICEEARLNPEAATFVTSNGYQIRSGQTAAAQKGTDIEFPTPAIEVKVDWIPGTDFKPAFTCDNPPKGVHVETIDGTCYAMAGIHISSKLAKNWIWATFEPQSMQTNPLRCITFGKCNDPWGSNPATSSGGASGFTQQTPAVQSLMTQANLASEFSNYRLDGVQTDFTTANGAPTYLGNSVIEGENVGMKKNTASCITCHSESAIQKTGTDNIQNIKDLVGPQYKVPAGWIARDFVWSMALACPGGIQDCK
jgi:hypothetical protein